MAAKVARADDVQRSASRARQACRPMWLRRQMPSARVVQSAHFAPFSCPRSPFSAALLFFPSGNEIHAFYPFVRHASDAGCLPAGRGPAGRRLLGLRFHFAQGSQRHHAVPDQHRAG
ncbi:hypothetical protein CBM2633_A100275 [Cupriavidus taiwanensis]|nr:hypothetical protein CBM2604_A120246 [Cupriavidus taiwanensis]SOZ25523.1 hypothetical protein CBM2609_A140248 [Cupriavidus taiwanensis]SPA12028.1 hypothetical protein CBM2633_A100275 [Cupriavidus taiwanensis]